MATRAQGVWSTWEDGGGEGARARARKDGMGMGVRAEARAGATANDWCATAQAGRRACAPVERVGNVPGGENGKRGLLDGERRPVRVREAQRSLGRRIEDGRDGPRSAASRPVLGRPLPSGRVDLLVENTVDHVHLLWVQVGRRRLVPAGFAVDGPQHCVGIARDPVLLEQVVYVGAELCLAALAESHQNRTALLQVLGHGVEFLRRELLARAGDHKNGSVAQPLQRDRVLVHGELEVGGELAPQHLEPGRQVEDLVVRDVKGDGGKSRHGSWNYQLRVLRVTSPLAGGGKRARRFCVTRK